MRLLLDEMLGRTVKWLRIFGVDAEAIKPKSDEELIEYAEREKRILVTKDEELAKKCERQKINILFLKKKKIEEQLSEIKNKLGIDLPFPEKTRCPVCNTELRTVNKQTIVDIVPASVLCKNEKFWLCEKCKKAYWEGSHWKNINKMYDSVMNTE